MIEYRCKGRCGTIVDFPGMCDTCYNKEFGRTDELKKAELENKLSQRRDNYEDFAGIFGIPELYRKVSFDSLTSDDNNKKAIMAARKFAAKPRGFLFFHGDAGGGKTWLAVSIAREIILAGRVLLFARSIDFLHHVREGFSDNSSMEKMKMYKDAPFLVLDDLGSEKFSEWVSEAVYDLLDYRHVNVLPMVITSNLGGNAIKEVFGARVISRIVGAGLKIELAGPDRRLS